MTSAWPGTLPQKLMIAGNTGGMRDGRIVSETDIGPGKMRLRSSSSAKPLSGTMMMTLAQWDILEAFVGIDLGGGSLPFTMPAQMDDGDDLLVRFPDKSLPTWSAVGRELYLVSMTLEVMP